MSIVSPPHGSYPFVIKIPLDLEVAAKFKGPGWTRKDGTSCLSGVMEW